MKESKIVYFFCYELRRILISVLHGSLSTVGLEVNNLIFLGKHAAVTHIVSFNPDSKIWINRINHSENKSNGLYYVLSH